MNQQYESFLFFAACLTMLFLVGFTAMGWNIWQAVLTTASLIITAAVIYGFAVLVCTL